MYPGNAEFPYNEQEMQSKQRSSPACHAQQDESSDSTRVLAKMRRNRKSQLSDAMRAKLGPQMPGMGGEIAYSDGFPTAPIVTDWLPYPLVQQPVGDLVSMGPPGSVSRQLDDMLSTPFNPYIINYKPSRGFMVPKFSTYDGTNDPIDHIMHYR